MPIDPDKLEQLDALTGKLIDVYLHEADPEHWATAEKIMQAALDAGETPTAAKKMAAAWKGERYWEKKNANQTMSMILNALRLLDQSGCAADDNGDRDKRTSKEISKAEKEVKKRLSRSRPQLVVSRR